MNKYKSLILMTFAMQATLSGKNVLAGQQGLKALADANNAQYEELRSATRLTSSELNNVNQKHFSEPLRSLQGEHAEKLGKWRSSANRSFGVPSINNDGAGRGLASAIDGAPASPSAQSGASLAPAKSQFSTASSPSFTTGAGEGSAGGATPVSFGTSDVKPAPKVVDGIIVDK